MDRMIKAAVILAVSLVFLLQCNPNEFSLFPEYLTSITHSRSVGEYFSGESNSFFLYRIWADSKEFVYIVQLHPNGVRKLAVFDGSLNFIMAFEAPFLGRMHAELEPGYHLVGRSVFDYRNTLKFTENAAFGTALDEHVARNSSGNTYYIISVTHSTTQPLTMVNYLGFMYNTISHDFTASGNNTCSIGDPDRFYALEAAQTANSTMVIVVRDVNTFKGLVVRMSSPINVLSTQLVSIGPIASGSVSITTNGEVVATGLDGRMRVFGSEGDWHDETPASYFSGLLIAYGSNNTMYLFNPGSRQLVKARAWWEND